jgi:hypothetical protein
MAINTSGFAVPGSIPTLVGPQAPPVVFKYADGSTMAPNSHMEGYAQGMVNAGQSLGQAIQQAATNLNPLAIEQRRAALAQAQAEQQKAQMFAGAYERANQQTTQDQIANSPLANSAPSTPMPKSQGNGLIGLQSPSQGVSSITQSPGSFAFGGTRAIIDPSSQTGLAKDPRYENYLNTTQQANNPIADKVASDYLNNDAIKSYPTIATNYKIISDLQKRVDNGETLSTADTANLANAYANVTNPEGRAQGMSVQDIIAKSDLDSQIKTEFAKFYGGASTAIAPKIFGDLSKAATNNFKTRTQNANAARQAAMQTVQGSYLDNPNQLNNKFPDVVSIYNNQLGIGKKATSPQAVQLLAEKTKAIHEKNPNLTPKQALEMAVGTP